MKDKIKVIGINKSKGRFFLVLPKEDRFVEVFEDFLSRLGFTWVEAHGFFHPEPADVPEKNVDLKKTFDLHRRFLHEGYDIEMIIGKEKIFLLICFIEEKAENLNNEINRIFYM